MSNNHPESVDLLRCLDGELPAKEARAIRQHLEICWQCRAEAEEYEKTIGECIRYRKNVLQNNLPSPPAPWMDIYAAFSRIDATPERASFFQEALEWMRQSWLVPATVAAALACAVILNFRHTPSVQAAELLRKAAVAEQTPAVAARRLQIRTKSTRVERAARVTPTSGDASELEGLFRKANYSWEEPLSARSYETWRNGLMDKSDRVDEVSTRGVEGYTIRTSTSTGELASAALTVRRFDFRPTDARLEFRNQEWVEISEAPSEAPMAATQSPAIDAPSAAAPQHSLSVPAPIVPAAPGQELQVMAKLHQLGADLGEPVEVNRSGNRVVVSGAGISPERQQQIREAVAGMPNVDVRFGGNSAQPSQPATTQTIDGTASGEALRFQQRLERQLGGQQQFEEFSLHALDANEKVMARAYALRRLAQRFEPGVTLTPADRDTLAQLAREHAAQLQRSTAALEEMLNPVLAGLGGSASAVQLERGDRAWQHATEDLFQSARRVETLLAAMLDVSPRSSSPDLPSQLMTALARLRARAAVYSSQLP